MTQTEMFARPAPAAEGPKGTAVFSPDELYRWWLDRDLGGGRPLVSCGLNPSTATAVKGDNTVDKEIKYARSWGCGWYAKVNMYGYRTKDPKVLWAAWRAGVDIVGTENDDYIRKAVELVRERNGIFLAAWGKHPKPDRVRRVLEVIGDLVPIYTVWRNKDGSPKHPLYCPDNFKPIQWDPTKYLQATAP